MVGQSVMSATGMLGHRDVYVDGLSTTDPRLRSETVATKKTMILGRCTIIVSYCKNSG